MTHNPSLKRTAIGNLGPCSGPSHRPRRRQAPSWRRRVGRLAQRLCSAFRPSRWRREEWQWVGCVSSALYEAVFGQADEMNSRRRRSRCLQCVVDRSLTPLSAWRLHGSKVSKTVSSRVGYDGPDSLHCCRPPPWVEEQQRGRWQLPSSRDRRSAEHPIADIPATTTRSAGFTGPTWPRLYRRRAQPARPHTARR